MRNHEASPKTNSANNRNTIDKIFNSNRNTQTQGAMMKDQTTNRPDVSKINPETILAYGEHFIFRVDDQSRDYLFLDVEDPISGSSSVRIPMHVWHAIQSCGVRLFTLSHSSDDHLRDMSVVTVQARKAMYRNAKQIPSLMLTALDGFAPLGSADDPDEVQVQRAIKMLERRRAWEQGLLERAHKHVVMRTLSNVNPGIWDYE
jgi:hypothetical protein